MPRFSIHNEERHLCRRESSTARQGGPPPIRSMGFRTRSGRTLEPHPTRPAPVSRRGRTPRHVFADTLSRSKHTRLRRSSKADPTSTFKLHRFSRDSRGVTFAEGRGDPPFPNPPALPSFHPDPVTGGSASGVVRWRIRRTVRIGIRSGCALRREAPNRRDPSLSRIRGSAGEVCWARAGGRDQRDLNLLARAHSFARVAVWIA